MVHLTTEKMKILVVENNVPSREYLQDLLHFEGYDCEVASNGEEGLALYDEYKPDLILSDVRMPYMDGLTLLRTLRQNQSDVFFVLTTAYGGPMDVNDAYRQGVNDYLVKPIDSELLLKKVRKYNNIISNRKLRQEVEGKVINKSLKIKFPTKYEHIPAMVSRLISDIAVPISGVVTLALESSLTELITNAIEHGNLEITSAEKNRSHSCYEFDKLIEERMKDPKLAGRFVTVDYHQTENYVEWIISDEGQGFDWRDVLDPTDDANILKLSGRGIYFTKRDVDEIEYLGRGNIVRIKKYFR